MSTVPAPRLGAAKYYKGGEPVEQYEGPRRYVPHGTETFYAEYFDKSAPEKGGAWTISFDNETGNYHIRDGKNAHVETHVTYANAKNQVNALIARFDKRFEIEVPEGFQFGTKESERGSW